MNHKEELDEWREKYEIAKNELKEDIRELQKGYERKIREINAELNELREKTRKKDSQIKEKNYQIKEVNKGMEIGNTHVSELQDEVNKYKQNYFSFQNKQK